MIDYTTLINTDIYLIDQILKGRYRPNEQILDAGCGGGRNLTWFVSNGLNVFGIDQNNEKVDLCRTTFRTISENFVTGNLVQLPYADQSFDHIICSAVLHFAESTTHFQRMFAELTRVLKKNGSLFIRMTTDVGLPQKPSPIGKGVYYLKDETSRFLLTRGLLSRMQDEYQLELLEPFKTTLVEDIRSMATVVLIKV